MKKKILISFLITLVFILLQNNVRAQEFPIATGSDTTVSSGGAFDGTNYLLGIQGDILNSNSVTAQLISASGSLVGSRISLGTSGGSPLVAFDGSNYLMAWSNIAKDIVYGQFINTSGTLVGSNFVIANNGNISPPKGGCIAFGNNTYMVVYKNNNINYAQCVDKSGNLIGTPTQTSTDQANDNSIVFDGINYLLVWCKKGAVIDQDIYGQFINQSGALVGSNFIIDDGKYASDNPVSIAFDGTKFLVPFHEQAASGGGWNLFARFVSSTGIVDPNRITIRDSTNRPGFDFIAFDGTNYLLTWADNMFSPKSVVKGRFFNTSGVPMDTEFTIFNKLNNKVPVYGGPLFADNKFLIITTRLDSINLSDGDVYGKFISSSATAITDNKIRKIYVNVYPNPASDILTLNINSRNKDDLTLNIYNATGTLVKSEILKQNQRQISIGDLSNGIYMVEIKSKGWKEKQKLIIQR